MQPAATLETAAAIDARTASVNPVLILALALVTGVVGGLGAVLFRLMIGWIGSAFGAGETAALGPATHDLVFLAPAVGLLAVSIITTRFAREVRGHGVPQILESLGVRGGRIRPRVGLFGILAPAITIGSGGSVGREGPIALIGAAFGSTMGQILRLPDRYIGLLLACGSAAGIGATFNAPIAGGFFGLEVILGTYAMGAMVPVFLASVAGVATFSAIEGSRAVLEVPAYVPGPPEAVFAAIGLGLLGALVGLSYTRGLDTVERLFERIPLPVWLRAVLGGAAVGALGLLWPQILGVGYPTMHSALIGALPIGLLAILLLAKYVATMVTIGAGGSGGVFAPSLFLGATLGGLYGGVLHAVFPAVAPTPQVYAVAGMATVFAAAAQAPFVAITILLEITGDYRLTILVMAAAAVAYLTYASFSRDSMYTVRLSRRGIKILRGNDVRPIEDTAVSTAMEPVPALVPWETPVRDAYRQVGGSQNGIVAVAEKGGPNRLAGLVSVHDLAPAATGGDWDRPVGEYAVRAVTTMRPTDTLDETIRRLSLHDASVLPVEEANGRLVGLVTVQGVMRVYQSTTLPALLSVRTPARDGDPGTFLEVRLSHASPAAGRRLADLELPPDVVVVSVRRGDATFAPRGATAFRVGDRVTLYCATSSHAAAIRSQFETGLTPDTAPG